MIRNQTLAESFSVHAELDQLIICLDRSQLLLQLNRVINECRLFQQELGLLFIDLDGFKHINGSYGYAVGDKLLSEVVGRIKNYIPKTSILAQMGGDEFVICFKLNSSIVEALDIANTVIESLDKPFIFDGYQLRTGASIGISMYGLHNKSAEQLIKEADAARYQAKREGRGCAHLFNNDLNEKSKCHYRLLSALNNAIKDDFLELHYQLLFDMHTFQPCGIEALLRLPNGEGSLYPPDQFIPIAKQHGLMDVIERWVIAQACADNAKLIQSGIMDVVIAVNVSMDMFTSPGLVELVQDSLERSGLAAERLELEITEDMTMRTSGSVQEVSERLHEIGVRLVMDDFGIGFSSIKRLKEFKFDKIKVDRSFVSDLPGSSNDKAFVRVMLDIARELDIPAVAEGIENELQLEYLREIGFKIGQGFWYAKPMPFDKLVKWLRKNILVVEYLDDFL